MKRKDFIKNTLTAGIVGSSIIRPIRIKKKESDYDSFMENIGFNHLPNKENKTMNTVLHKANTRGHANHGWLDTYHTFSFANYRNPERMHFGALRVLNDDMVAAGKGFGTHPHDNMEIISIPLSGDLEHKDSMGNVTVIKEGDVQVMSAGKGVYHSEYNKNADQEVRFLQIWLFPNKKDVNPRYDQISLEDIKAKNKLYQILSPNSDDAGVWIHQNAWFSMGEYSDATSEKYTLNDSNNGIYAFVLEGDVNIEDQDLNKRDGFGIWNTKEINIKANPGSKLLLMEVPMKF